MLIFANYGSTGEPTRGDHEQLQNLRKPFHCKAGEVLGLILWEP